MISPVTLDSRRTLKKISVSVKFCYITKHFKTKWLTTTTKRKRERKTLLQLTILRGCSLGHLCLSGFFQPGARLCWYQLGTYTSVISCGVGWQLVSLWWVSWDGLSLLVWCLFLQEASLSLTVWWQQQKLQEQQEDRPPCTSTFQAAPFGHIKTHAHAKSQCGRALANAWIQVVGTN